MTELYNALTGETRRYTDAKSAHKAARRAYNSDRCSAHWILLERDRLYRTRLLERHCGSAGYVPALSWQRIERDDLPAVLVEMRRRLAGVEA